MKRRVLALVAVVIFFLSLSAQAQEIAPSSKLNSPSSNRFSIGVNDLPWDATKISLRWWKNENRGHELSLGYFRAEIGDREYTSDYATHNEDLVEVRVTEIRCDWLRRKKSPLLDELYITGGIGFAVDFSVRSDEIRDVYDTVEFRGEYKFMRTSFYARFPIGFEHFFLKKYTNISYSLEADFYAGVGYDYASSKHEGLSLVKSETKAGEISLGVTPRFYFRFYLK
ncbi:MAG: hypothetical protein MUO85_02550 [candidate division Zixibacteria bacterium]|nr:hypothetical protein [candidate division Zixibacteria bacterium]